MKIKTSEASGAALDWLVAKCEGYTGWCGATEKLLPPRKEYGYVALYDLNYSTDWAKGGPIGEGEKIEVFFVPASVGAVKMPTVDCPHPKPYYGPTELVARMRCYVASKLGEEVDVPEELVGGAP